MFKKLKKMLLERIENDCVKSVLSYKPSKNSDEVVTETVYLRRSKMPLIGDWGRIYPPINEDGSINWFNLLFGGRKNLIKLLMIMMIIAFILLGYFELFNYIEAIKPYCQIPTLYG